MLQLKKYPDIPVFTREEHRGSCHNSRGAPFAPPQFKMSVPFSASLGKGSRCSCRISRGGALNRNVERKSRGSATITKDLKISQPTPDKPDFAAFPRLSPGVSTYTTVARVTALWHLEGKAQSVQLDRKKYTASTAREERGRAHLLSRGGLNPLWRPQWYPKNHVSSGH